MTKDKKNKKITLIPLILMMFTSVFGFANMPRSFYLMGYSSIPWYIISAVAFCIPLAFMIAEYGAAFKNEKGGMYSWMEKSVNSKYAFIGTFMWYASFIIWMINISSTIWIPLSNAIFGKDVTSSWSIFGLNSTQTLGLLAMVWVVFVTVISTKGLDKIKKITSLGGIAVTLLNVVLLIGAIFVLILNHGELAEPIKSVGAFFKSPNPDYTRFISTLSFLVFAIFAFGGIELIGSVVDETENPEVVFPKAITIGAITISVGYAIGIFLCGIFTSWGSILSSKDVNMANVAYVVMQNLGYSIGNSLGLQESISILIGAWVARFVGISMFLALTGAFFNATFMPLKQLIEGTPYDLWPGKLGEVRDGMPKFAMKIQCIIVVIMIFLVSFGGEGASQFFAKLVLMTNVAMTLPIAFLAGAFISFKKKKNIERPFEIYKGNFSYKIATFVVTGTVCFANFFTIIEPITKGKYSDSIWMIVGPIFFTIIALVILKIYSKKNKLKDIEEDVA